MKKELEQLSIEDLQKIIDSKKVKTVEKKKKAHFSKFIVMAIVILNAVFAYKVFQVFGQIGNEPTALIGAWFGFTTIELWSLSKIKRDEITKEEECDINE